MPLISRGVKSTWKPYLSKSTDILQWKLLYKSPIPKPTWVKVLEYLILTALKYFSYTKYRLKDALVKETSQSKTVTLWRSWGKQAEARIYVQVFHGKTRTSNKPTTGEQTTITFNNSQRTKETLGLYIHVQEANKLIKIRYILTTNTMGDRKWQKSRTRHRKCNKNKKELICEERNHTYFLKPK